MDLSFQTRKGKRIDQYILGREGLLEIRDKKRGGSRARRAEASIFFP